MLREGVPDALVVRAYALGFSLKDENVNDTTRILITGPVFILTSFSNSHLGV